MSKQFSKSGSQGSISSKGGGGGGGQQGIYKCEGCNGQMSKYDPRVSTGNLNFHRRCFQCGECGASLVGKPFFSVHSTLRVCEMCYNGKYAEMCHACGKRIVGTATTTGDGTSFHPDCFKCDACGNKITSAFKQNEEGKYEHAYNCCKKHSANQKGDNCRDCGRVLVNVKYFVVPGGGKACSDCYRSNHAATCFYCHRPIMSGQSHVVKDWKFHKDCFKCRACGVYLGKRRIRIDGASVVCYNCSDT